VTYVVIRTAPGHDQGLMPPNWDGRWFIASGSWYGAEIMCYGNGPDHPATSVFRLTDKTEERSDGEIALVWELSAL
jgi:hypothetical protein